MTNAFYWERLQPVQFINFLYDDKAVHALTEYFGEFPIILTEIHLPLLRSWQKIGAGSPLGALIKAVEENKEIRVWVDGGNYRRVYERERHSMIVRPQRASLQPYEEVDRDDPINQWSHGLDDSIERMVLDVIPVPPVLKDKYS